MALPIRNLPVLQNWDCHACSDCCRIEAEVSVAEKDRIEKLDLAGDPEVGSGPWFVGKGWSPRRWLLKRRADGRCVFLTSQNRCRLHERFGVEAKPFACRLFPFLLIPAGSHWRVGLHYACPSAAENKGRRLAEREGELLQLAHLLEKHVGRSADSAPPPSLQPGQQLAWPELLRIVARLVDIMQDRRDRVDRRLRKCLALAKLCRQARLENLGSDRLEVLLKLLESGLDAEVTQIAAEMAPPGWLGRVLFRTLLAIFARKDVGLHRGSATRGPLGRLISGWRFVRGRGLVPHVNAFVPEITFEEIEQRPSPPAELDEALERYYVTKLHSLQFCGPPNFDLPFWTGLESLALTLPMILWLSRAFVSLSPQAALEKAVMLVDDHFGGNPILGLWPIRFFLGTLSQRGELERLLAWYSR